MTDTEILEQFPFISIPATICKSNLGEADENGNYIFEVEASNENLDLQNQKILQTALLKSKDYFLSNGIVSDDHQHKTRNPDGSVETHKDKIIGEPISIRTDGKRTFVKGILYSAVEAAKPFIDLLKAGSSRVKASVGGIMPTTKTNPDGSETVTSFMWNDLALTCSPVNYTVGPARFAKSMTELDFCKALMAGGGTDAANYTDGRALQNEDIEEKTKDILDVTGEIDMKNLDKDEVIEKSEDPKTDDDIIAECIISIDTGELSTIPEIENFLIERGFSNKKAKDTCLEIIEQGGKRKMVKGNFTNTINDLLKSLDGNCEKKEAKKAAVEDDDIEKDKTVVDDSEGDEPEEDDDNVEKSLDDEYVDVTAIMKDMGETIDAQNETISTLQKSIEELQDNLVAVTKSFGDYLKTPNSRTTVVTKSINDGNNLTAAGNKKPTARDFDILKSCLVKASKEGAITLDEVQFYNAEFQKSMKGQKVNPDTMNRIFDIVHEYK